MYFSLPLYTLNKAFCMAARYECHDRIVRVKKIIPKMFDVEVAICVSLFITITRTSRQITVIIYRYRKSQYLTRATNPKKRR